MTTKIKILIALSLLVVFFSCADGGDECPPRDTTITYRMDNGDIGLEIIAKGDLAERAVMSQEECNELINDYKKKQAREKSKTMEERYNER